MCIHQSALRFKISFAVHFLKYAMSAWNEEAISFNLDSYRHYGKHTRTHALYSSTMLMTDE
jgi:hypothetical protein